MERLREEKIALTVCPLSNVRLRVFDAMEQHNLKQLLDLDLRVTINSDDPSYFGGYMNANFLAAQRALGLEREDIYHLVRNSFQVAFAVEERKEALIQELDEYVAGAT